MANIIREVLNSSGMALTLYCGGMSKVGINIAALTQPAAGGNILTFLASTDGLNFRAVNVSNFPPTGNSQSTTTLPGFFELLVQNYVAVQVQFSSYVSGSATVIMAAAIDSSYQDAFLTPIQKYVSSYKLGGGQNIMVIPAQTNRAWRCRTLTVSAVGNVTGWQTQPVLQIIDGTFPGGNNIWAGDLLGQNQQNTVIPLPADPDTPGLSGGGVVGTPGNQMTIVLASPVATSSGSSGSGGSLALATAMNAEIVAA
jgi:hypothetical protein